MKEDIIDDLSIYFKDNMRFKETRTLNSFLSIKSEDKSGNISKIKPKNERGFT